MQNLEIENARLRAWLETIQKTAAEVRIIDMATMAIAGIRKPGAIGWRSPRVPNEEKRPMASLDAEPTQNGSEQARIGSPR